MRISGSATPVCSYYSRRGGPMQKTSTHCEEPVRNWSFRRLQRQLLQKWGPNVVSRSGNFISTCMKEKIFCKLYGSHQRLVNVVFYCKIYLDYRFSERWG